MTVNLAIDTQQNTIGSGSDALFHIENLRGSNFDDHLTGNSLNNVLEGGLGHDVLDGGAAGSDTASYQHATAGVTVSLAQQNVQQNTVGAGLDTLTNMSNLTGSDHNDTLTGDNNANALTGGAGSDRFVFAANDGHDTVTDFLIGLDQIELNGFFASASDPAFTTFLADLQSAANGVHDISLAGTTITLSNVNVNQPHNTDFVVH